MQPEKSLTSIIAIALILGAIFQAKAQELPDQTVQVSQPSIDLPPDLERILRDYERHWRNGNNEGLSLLFVEDGLIAHSGTWIRGRIAIREAYEGSSSELQLRAIEYAIEDRLGYIIGAYGFGSDPPVPDAGMFVLTLQRTNEGRWLIVSDLDKSVR